jgi:hypothetical protein
VRPIHTDVHLGRFGSALPPDSRAFEPSAPVQHLPDDTNLSQEVESLRAPHCFNKLAAPRRLRYRNVSEIEDVVRPVAFP